MSLPPLGAESSRHRPATFGSCPSDPSPPAGGLRRCSLPRSSSSVAGDAAAVRQRQAQAVPGESKSGRTRSTPASGGAVAELAASRLRLLTQPATPGGVDPTAPRRYLAAFVRATPQLSPSACASEVAQLADALRQFGQAEDRVAALQQAWAASAELPATVAERALRALVQAARRALLPGPSVLFASFEAAFKLPASHQRHLMNEVVRQLLEEVAQAVGKPMASPCRGADAQVYAPFFAALLMQPNDARLVPAQCLGWLCDVLDASHLRGGGLDDLLYAALPCMLDVHGRISGALGEALARAVLRHGGDAAWARAFDTLAAQDWHRTSGRTQALCAMARIFVAQTAGEPAQLQVLMTCLAAPPLRGTPEGTLVVASAARALGLDGSNPAADAALRARLLEAAGPRLAAGARKHLESGFDQAAAMREPLPGPAPKDKVPPPLDGKAVCAAPLDDTAIAQASQRLDKLGGLLGLHAEHKAGRSPRQPVAGGAKPGDGDAAAPTLSALLVRIDAALRTPGQALEGLMEDLRAACAGLAPQQVASALRLVARKLKGPAMAPGSLDLVLRSLFDPARPWKPQHLEQSLDGLCRELGGAAMQDEHRHAMIDRGLAALGQRSAGQPMADEGVRQRVDLLARACCASAPADSSRVQALQPLHDRLADPRAGLPAGLRATAYAALLAAAARNAGNPAAAAKAALALQAQCALFPSFLLEELGATLARLARAGAAQDGGERALLETADALIGAALAMPPRSAGRLLRGLVRECPPAQLGKVLHRIALAGGARHGEIDAHVTAMVENAVAQAWGEALADKAAAKHLLRELFAWLDSHATGPAPRLLALASGFFKGLGVAVASCGSLYVVQAARQARYPEPLLEELGALLGQHLGGTIATPVRQAVQQRIEAAARVDASRRKAVLAGFARE